MRRIFTILSLTIILLLAGCTSNAKPILKGGYQSEREGVGYTVVISFQPDDSSFVEYIDNREVDRGTYIKNENNIYKIKSDKQNFDITLNAKNSFDITIKKLNNGKPIQLKNVSVTPTYFITKFDDVDKYKALLDSETSNNTQSNISNVPTEQSVEVVNTIKNGGNSIQLVIKAGSLNTPTYVKLGYITEVKNMEVRLFIYLKNKDLLSYQDSRNLNQPQMVITARPSSCQVMAKNSISDHNSFNCSVDIQSSPDKLADISIEEIYDKNAKQILAKPVTFKLKLVGDIK